MTHRFAAAILAALLFAAAPPGGAPAVRAAPDAEACADPIAPLAEAAELIERCADFAEPRAMLAGGSPADLMTTSDLVAAAEAGAASVCWRSPMRQPPESVPAEIRFEARIEPARVIPAADEFFLPDAVALSPPLLRAAWSARLAGGEWSRRVEPSDWTVPASRGWRTLP